MLFRSVPAKYQTTKQNISEILKGFERNEKGQGYVIFRAKGWDYPGLCEMYEKGIRICREEHVPVLFHIQEVTQPQGHSTSGSHERYKSKERLKWEEEFDGLKKMREWMIASALATAEECDEIESAAKKYVNDCRKKAWDDFMSPIKSELALACGLIRSIADNSPQKAALEQLKSELEKTLDPSRQIGRAHV